MDVTATFAAEEVRICSRIWDLSTVAPKLQFVATTRTTARIDIGTMHRAS